MMLLTILAVGNQSGMDGHERSEYICLEVGESDDIDEVVIAYRMDGELHELMAAKPPLRAEIERT
jgi:hypothetical protein